MAESNINKRQNRDFGSKKIYLPKKYDNLSNCSGCPDYSYPEENRFRFKNSLVITPFHETEFNVSGGIKHVRNHDNRVLFTNSRIFAVTNGVLKIPVLMKRGINRQSVQKKLIVEEKYNYEEKYEIYKNIILYYEENRIDFQILFNKLEKPEDNPNHKDITTEFSLNLSVPGTDDIIAYKKYDGKQEYGRRGPEWASEENNINNLEYIIAGRETGHGESCMTLYPDKRHFTRFKNKSFSFSTPNGSQPQKNYINLKIYLEKYKIT